MTNEQTPNVVSEMETIEFEAPRLTAVGDARDVVMGVPMSGWDWRGYAMRHFEFLSDE
jgi:hypothetical protein